MKYDVPLYHHLLNPAIITLCHTVTPDNFGKYRVCVEFLVSEGKVDINAKRHSDGCTALMIACKRGVPPMVSVLLDLGADVSLTSKWGLSAIMIVFRATNNTTHTKDRPIETLTAHKHTKTTLHSRTFKLAHLRIASALSTIDEEMCMDENKSRCMDENKSRCMDENKSRCMDENKSRCMDENKSRCMDENKSSYSDSNIISNLLLENKNKNDNNTDNTLTLGTHEEITHTAVTPGVHNKNNMWDRPQNQRDIHSLTDSRGAEDENEKDERNGSQGETAQFGFTTGRHEDFVIIRRMLLSKGAPPPEVAV
eukprot:GHVR01142529.1.p1 GENE.GHVR01142529.1~~GHVR01142529.1.p1  ORF type:complete len:310 (-),score=70.08 GHVR01142529.1:71-1000(-)